MSAESSSPGGVDIDAFIVDQTMRGLDRQATVLSELRQRTSIVLTAVGIVASLLGAEALKNGHPRGVVYVALAATATGIVLCLLALKSVHDEGEDREWKVTVSKEQLNQLRTGETGLSDVIADLITFRAKNHGTIRTMSKWVFLASATLPVQIGLWAVVLLW